jgi:GNAT superfamily N-acetyltransferase
MYSTLIEMNRRGDMATIAERSRAKKMTIPAKGMTIRGYDFDPHNLNEDEKDFVFRSLFPIGLTAFVQNPSTDMENDVKQHLFEADHLVVMRADGTYSFGKCELGAPAPIAFRMWKTFDLPIGKACYLAGMCVYPAWQGRGIGQELTRYALASDQFDYVFTVTQNPVVKLSMDKATGVISSPCGDVIDNSVFAEALGKKGIYDPKTQILRGNYGASLYGILPHSRDEDYNVLFSSLNREAGDAYLLVAKL